MESNKIVDQKILAKYRLAEKFEHESCVESMVLNAQIFPHWIDGSDCFWYIHKFRKQGMSPPVVAKSFRLVDAQRRTNCEAFDHQLFANALSRASKNDVESINLPISQLVFDLETNQLEFSAFGKSWRYAWSSNTCEELEITPCNWLVSPDKEKALLIRDYNLWVRHLKTGEEYALTSDGQKHYAYAVQPERVNMAIDRSDKAWLDATNPEALWSPDSKKILTVHVDEREVPEFPTTCYVPSDGAIRPHLIQTKYALPEDQAMAKFELLAIDLETRKVCKADYSAILDTVILAGLFSGNRAWWSDNGDKAFFLDVGRGQQQVKVIDFDTTTGATGLLFQELSDTYIDLSLEFERPAYLLPLPASNELIWFSERSGWAHLYLYDLNTGVCKNQITGGDWLVREILHIDINRRELIIQVAGRIKTRDPYYREICLVNIDTGNLEVIASGNYDHLVCTPTSINVVGAISFSQATTNCNGVSSDGQYIATSRSRIDDLPITILLDRAGNVVMEVERADISGLPGGWQWPEPVKLLADDQKTDIYGVVFRPTDFSPDKNYPVINWVHSNPFYAEVPKGAFHCNTLAGYAYMSASAYAELGFIVVIIDGRGTCYRSKAFHDESYGKIENSSHLDDQIAGLQQLAEKYPYIDLDRVGITNHGGSNAPVYGLLAYPDFYKVGVAYSIWDIRLLTKESETYHGLSFNAATESTVESMARHLEGKLLLMHGMLDPYFHVAGALQLADILVRNNKDFDLVLLPNGGHTWDSCRYGVRRSWDYFVKYLGNEDPPCEFRLSNYAEFAMDKMRLG